MMESLDRINIEDELEAIDALLEGGKPYHSPKNSETKPISALNHNYSTGKAKLDYENTTSKINEGDNSHFYSIYNVKPNHDVIDQFLASKQQQSDRGQYSKTQSTQTQSSSPFSIKMNQGNKESGKDSMPSSSQVLEELRKNNLYLAKLEQKISNIGNIPQIINKHQENVITEMNSNNYYLSKLITKVDQLIQIMITNNKGKI